MPHRFPVRHFCFWSPAEQGAQASLKFYFLAKQPSGVERLVTVVGLVHCTTCMLLVVLPWLNPTSRLCAASLRQAQAVPLARQLSTATGGATCFVSTLRVCPKGAAGSGLALRRRRNYSGGKASWICSLSSGLKRISASCRLRISGLYRPGRSCEELVFSPLCSR